MTSFVSEQFSDAHDASDFDCGEPDLDDWLRKSAMSSDGRGITRTYVWVDRHDPERRVRAHHATMPYTIDRETLSRSQGRGLTSSIPGYLLARLALHRDLQGERLGSALLAEALRRLAGSALAVGGRFVVVDALNDTAVSFYVKHGFAPLPDAPDRLIMRVKEIVAKLDASMP